MKYIKYHKLKKQKFQLFSLLTFGTYGLQTIKQIPFKIDHLNLIIKLLKRCLKFYNKKNIFFIKKYPNIMVTKKPKEIRMGRGKGIFSHKTTFFIKGQLLLEIKNLNKILEFYICNILKNKFNYLRIFQNNLW